MNKTLKSLIEKQKFDWVSDFVKEFPYEKPRKGDTKIFQFDTDITSEEAIKKMQQEDYEPMSATELVEYISEQKGKIGHWLVALGTRWLDPDGYLSVLVFRWDGSQRKLDYFWFDGTWRRQDYRFAGRRAHKSLKNSNPETLNFDARLKKLEAWRDRIMLTDV